MPTDVFPSVFVPHGAGPCFFMDWNPPGIWDRMAAWLRGVAARIGANPRAIVVVSAHWQAPSFTVNAQSALSLLYDYSGFPAHTYQLTWPAPGAPALAGRIRELLAVAGIDSVEAHERGLDHGVFIPLKLMFPEADVPVVQLPAWIRGSLSRWGVLWRRCGSRPQGAGRPCAWQRAISLYVQGEQTDRRLRKNPV